MNGARISIAAVMAIIALVAFDLAAVRVASDDWVDFTRYATIAMLVVATSLAWSRRMGRGGWWFGFALLGWAYFALVLDATARLGFTMARGTRRAKVMPLGTLLELVHLLCDSGSIHGQSPLERLWNRYEILQSILTLVVACIGGIVCWILALRRGAPYRERSSRAGRLDLHEEEPES
jgi:hypothetical protein